MDKHFVNVKCLNLFQCMGVDQGLEALGKNSSIHCVELGHCKFFVKYTFRGLLGLTSCTLLRKLTAGWVTDENTGVSGKL